MDPSRWGKAGQMECGVVAHIVSTVRKHRQMKAVSGLLFIPPGTPVHRMMLSKFRLDLPSSAKPLWKHFKQTPVKLTKLAVSHKSTPCQLDTQVDNGQHKIPPWSLKSPSHVRLKRYNSRLGGGAYL